MNNSGQLLFLSFSELFWTIYFLATSSRPISRQVTSSLQFIVIFGSMVRNRIFTHKKITVPTAPMSVKTVIASARSGVRTLDTLIKSQVLYQLS